MFTINMSLGKGLTTTDGKITLDFANSVPVTKTNGVFIDKSQIGSEGVSEGMEGCIDDYTVKKTGIDTNGHVNLAANPDVIPMIYTMGRQKRTTIPATSATYFNGMDSAHNKTIEDIIDELNTLSDYPESQASGTTTYRLTPGDLFQLRETSRPIDRNNSAYGWWIALDDLNRYENDVIKAMFHVNEAEYNHPSISNYLMKLSLRCIWIAGDIPQSFTVGTIYTGYGKQNTDHPRT